MNLINHKTGDVIRTATREEWARSFLAGGTYDVQREGVIEVDGVTAYVDVDPGDDEIEALETEAGTAGDDIQALLCRFAVRGWSTLAEDQRATLLAERWESTDEHRARHECLRVIAQAIVEHGK